MLVVVQQNGLDVLVVEVGEQIENSQRANLAQNLLHCCHRMVDQFVKYFVGNGRLRLGTEIEPLYT